MLLTHVNAELSAAWIIWLVLVWGLAVADVLEEVDEDGSRLPLPLFPFPAIEREDNPMSRIDPGDSSFNIPWNQFHPHY